MKQRYSFGLHFSALVVHLDTVKQLICGSEFRQLSRRSTEFHKMVYTEQALVDKLNRMNGTELSIQSKTF